MFGPVRDMVHSVDSLHRWKNYPNYLPNGRIYVLLRGAANGHKLIVMKARFEDIYARKSFDRDHGLVLIIGMSRVLVIS